MERIDELYAIEQIKQLKARYFRMMDTRDWSGMAQVFCTDAKFDCSEGFLSTPLGGEPEGTVGPLTHGREAIMAWIEDAFANQTSAHHGHCHEITIDSDSEAHGVIAMEDWIFAGDRKTRLLNAAGHYHERYRFEDGSWRIAETRLTRLFNNAGENLYALSAEEAAAGAD
ncbi:MAG: nuclear transport factor 2 family protein [Novosphingobium sp.]|nr:nuclear transport factor 2 family protein [Novosphingobium sp.]